MIIWGGNSGNGVFGDGGRYNPTDNSWIGIATAAPSSRESHSVVWTGTEMLMFGGEGASFFNDTYSYKPALIMYLYQRP